MWSGLCLAAWGGKRGLLLDSLGVAWGLASWGSGHTECRDFRLGAYPGPASSTSGTSCTQGLLERQCPGRTPLVTWPLLAQHSRAFLLQEQSLAALWRAGGAGCPQLGGDLVSAGLLGTSLFLCLEGVKSTDTVRSGVMTELGHHCLGGGEHPPGNHWYHGR